MATNSRLKKTVMTIIHLKKTPSSPQEGHRFELQESTKDSLCPIGKAPHPNPLHHITRALPTVPCTDTCHNHAYLRF